MKKVRLLSLKRWSHVVRVSWRYLASRDIAVSDKLLFLIPALLYWVLPDVMPFLPIDDIGVSLLLMNWFVSRAERKYPGIGAGRS